MRTSVKFGTDKVATPNGEAVSYTFNFHHDTVSDLKPVTTGTSDSSNWVCGPRTYSVVVDARNSASFMSIVDSPGASTLVKPVLNVLTNQDSDKGTWQVTLSVKLSRYPSVTASEIFKVKID